MADDLKISDMVEILSGDLHDDLAFEVIDLTEALVEDQNKQVKLVTLEQAFGAEDRIFKDTTIIRAWGDTDPAQVTMDLYESDNNAVIRVFDANGDLSRMDIGAAAIGTFLRLGIGSDPDVRIMSGSDTWFYAHPDDQRLGSTAAGNASLRVSQSGNGRVYAVIDGDTFLDLDPDSDTIVLGDKASADAYIELELNNWDIEYHNKNTHRFFNDGSLVAVLNSTGFNLLGGLVGCDFRINPDGGGDDVIFLNAQADAKTTFRNTITGPSTIDVLTLDPQNNAKFLIPLELGTGAAVDTIETTLTNDDTHLPTSGAVFDAIAAISLDTLSGDPIILNNPTWGTNLQIQGSYGDFRFVNMEADYAISMEGYDGVTKRTCATFDAHAGNFWYHIGAAIMKSVAAGIEINDTLQSYTNLYLKVDNNGTAGGQDNAIACIANGAVELYYNNIKEAETASGALKAVNALQIAAGNLINEFETTLTNDANKVPTSSAVFAAIAAIQPDIIQEGNSSVEVIDAGTGQVDVTVDGGLVARFLASGNMELGQDDTVRAILKMYGDAGGNGGRLELYKGATGTGSQRYVIEVSGNDIYIGQAFAESISYTPGTPNIWRIPETTRIDRLRLASSGGDQTGNTAIGNAATSVAVTFGTAQSDANYQVLCTVENTTDGSPLVLSAIITAKSTAGFTATLSAATDSANYVLNWLVTRS